MSDALQAALDAIGPATDEITARARGLIRGYHEAWQGSEWEAVSVEQVYTSPLVNPATLCKSRTFTFGGKLDVLARHNGKLYVIDHKTTSESVHDPDAPYWRHLQVDGQASQYMTLLHLNGIKVEGAMWDVIRKPGIRPKTLTKAERASAVADRKYFGQPMPMDVLAGLQTEAKEAPEMFEARLVADCCERPEWYFQRRPVPRLMDEILEYLQDVWQIGQEIRESRLGKRLVKNAGACMLYGSPCKFLGICAGHDTPDSDKWQRREHRHGELESDADMITHSRMRCWQTCQVKHHYQYELCLERQEEEEKESLFFGSLVHKALESWWSAFLPVEELNNGNNASGFPTSEVGKHSAVGAQVPG